MLKKDEIIDWLKQEYLEACDQMRHKKYDSRGYAMSWAVARRFAEILDELYNTHEHMDKVYTIDINKSLQSL